MIQCVWHGWRLMTFTGSKDTVLPEYRKIIINALVPPGLCCDVLNMWCLSVKGKVLPFGFCQIISATMHIGNGSEERAVVKTVLK